NALSANLVEALEAGERVKDRAKGPVAQAEPVVRVLVGLDRQEGDAQYPGQRQPLHEMPAATSLHGPHGQLHGDAAGHQQRRVQAWQQDLGSLASEALWRPGAAA